MSTAPATPVAPGMSGFDQAVHYLARQFYLALCEMRGFDRIDPPPHTPRWATDYAQISVSYLGYDDEALVQLARDYK